MKIQYCSDLHLEFRKNKEFLERNPIEPVGETLILAGDIAPFAVMDKHKNFFSYVSDRFDRVYWLPGNHEYYYFDAAKKSGTLHEKIRSNVFLVNNTSVMHGGVKLIFSTLWTKISPAYEWEIERNMSDFHVIKYNGYRFSASPYNQLHEDCLKFIKRELKLSISGKTVVATHHVPALMNYPEKYKGDLLNEAFAVELFDLIEPSGIASWIYGHHHCNTQEFEIGNTKMLTNQLGYVEMGEHDSFRCDKFFDL